MSESTYSCIGRIDYQFCSIYSGFFLFSFLPIVVLYGLFTDNDFEHLDFWTILNFALTVLGYGFRREDSRVTFFPHSRYLVFLGPFRLPVEVYSSSCFPSRFSPFFFDLGIFPLRIVGVVHSPASAYTPFTLAVPDWAAIVGTCDLPCVVSHGGLGDVL